MKIPKQEIILSSYNLDGKKTHIITRNIVGKYTLYEIKNEEEKEYIKIKTSNNPLDFDRIVFKGEKNE